MLSWDRDNMPCGAQNIHYLALYGKRLLTSVIEEMAFETGLVNMEDFFL